MSRDAILEAAFTILVERGYDALAIEAVAKMSGTGKTTVYRWWSSKAELAADAFLHATADELHLPDTGSARDDFRCQIIALSELLRGRRGQALAAMLGGARTDAALGRALGQRWLEPRRRWGTQRMMRAAASGQLKPGVDPSAALSVLYGPLYAPLLFGGAVPDRPAVEAYLDIACAGVFA